MRNEVEKHIGRGSGRNAWMMLVILTISVLIVFVALGQMPDLFDDNPVTTGYRPVVRYISAGKVFEMNPQNGTTTKLGDPEPKTLIRGTDRLFWIDEGDGDNFRILQADLDGRNTSTLLTGDAFFSRMSDSPDGPYLYGPTMLAVNKNQTHVFFDAGVPVIIEPQCYLLSLDLATNAISEQGFWCGSYGWRGFGISPDGSHVVSVQRESYTVSTNDVVLVSTFLYSQQGRTLLNYAVPFDVEWLKNGGFVYSVGEGYTTSFSSSMPAPPEVNEDGKRIIVADEDGNTIRVLATHVLADQIAVSPDQQYLAYITLDLESRELQDLWMMKLDGSAREKIANVSDFIRKVKRQEPQLNIDVAWR